MTMLETMDEELKKQFAQKIIEGAQAESEAWSTLVREEARISDLKAVLQAAVNNSPGDKNKEISAGLLFPPDD